MYIIGSASVLPAVSRGEMIPGENSIGISDINYGDYIEPGLLRRMTKVIRMAIVSAKIALQKAEIDIPEAIIVGTGLGCLTDTQRFLTDLCNSQEGIISPTSFIQSTHNSIAGQVALLLHCTGYNSTYSDRNQSFEQALSDAKLHLKEGSDSLLVGASDECIDMVENVIKANGEANPLPTKDYFLGEGSSFFVISKNKKVDSVEIRDLKIFPQLTKAELKSEFNQFLLDNNLDAGKIDAVVLGDWPESNDPYYRTITEELEKSTPKVYFKKQCGHYFTSSAYALDTACYILKNQHIPDDMRPSGSLLQEARNILIYNQYKGIKHSFFLISK